VSIPPGLPETLEEAHALILKLLQRIEEQDKRIEEQDRRIDELERRLNMNSQNSSKPPSSDPPSVKLPPKKKPSGRKPGGQPGHKGSHRELLPLEQVDEFVDHWPGCCEECQRPMGSGIRVEVGEAVRHQVTEVPEVKAHTTEHRTHTQECRRCGHATEAELPPEIPRGAFGPRMQAVIALFTGGYHVSKRTAESALGDLFGVTLSLGSVSASEQAISVAVAQPVAEAREYVERQPVVHADETSWRQRRQKAWLWIAGTTLVTVFLIHANRSAAAARALLGQFAGILVTDRWSAYCGWELARRQLCWAHLIRDFNFIAESKGTAGAIGEALLTLADDLFERWHRVRDGTLSRVGFKRAAKPIRERIELLLKQGCGCYAPKVAGMCWEILQVESAMWTFVSVAGVEPTNNFGERNLRPSVLWRKSSFGTHSEAGSRFAERMMTVVATLKLQHRNVFHYLVDASEAALHRRQPPSLLPVAA
jgi:transposase